MKRSVRCISFVVLTLLTVLRMSAQTTPTDENSVFAPFVSRIRPAVKDDMVKVSWLDSRDAVGPVFVFRSPTAFSTSNLSSAQFLVEVPYGTQSHIDRPPTAGPWFYYVAASDKQGTRYDIILPYGNSSGAPVSVTIKPPQPSIPVEASASTAVPIVPQPTAAVTDSTPTATIKPTPPAVPPPIVTNPIPAAPIMTVPTATTPAAAVSAATPLTTTAPTPAPSATIAPKPAAPATTAPTTAAPAIATIPPAPTALPILEPAFSGVEATVRGDAVAVSFKPGRDGLTALLYRSASPIRRISDLLDAIIILAGPAVSPLIDYPVPGIVYHYAILDESELKAGTAKIELGINSTAVAAAVPVGRYRIGLPGPANDIRSMPLPLISLSMLGDPTITIVPANLSPAANKAVKDLLSNFQPKSIKERKPRVFPQDMEAPAGGEEYTLRSIVQGVFAKRDWSQSATQLSGYLSLSRSATSEARARYYLGQSYYFLSRYREALFEFLLVQEQYGSEASEWIQAVLRHLISE